ncbi:1-(5-phosphoribosyl)-5-[(5-phosphoribosylamino)methylideneamino]imidazole-4-carboxamide isomerase [Miniphocaeibacter halophilus]|uniref:1-(5-phosphoribosyl)-5-[(5-phosphoribosylamino)methylideneamino]imidazole-4-carboxamide isomerase n=1 Tax=Miniphocaeibacter halophilus TaxID=2931922 RepID=A0AC61MQE1_9FIRM|nr:1-(5-phosphoribosyl)-5-[(5-phosphoribosylamino)methylideneamino]imidazole-4-carboxamide isomerase [Miniphocaeibacter halophilus]QQK07824.1 1-(5-phosphoribosyl)-5-[(5-phosphoribosylamino)methylideneamino]imidazole-4-carboxamide isomerase [Miniphocaeibacter halophilus]
MLILPAIDLKNRQCVRLHQGKEEEVTYYFDNPVEVAKDLEKKGAKYLHIIDLDGAFSNENRNYDIIEKIVKEISIPIQVGGGIRSEEIVNNLINLGVSRVILGTVAVENPKLVKSLIEKHGDKIAVSVDCYGEQVAIKGWVEKTDINIFDFCKELKNIGLKTIIYTDIKRDGTLEGPNIEILDKLQKEFGDNIIAAGGLSNIEDFYKLKEINLYGGVTGKALYEGKITMDEISKFS